jgi:hypothetical protein
MLRSASTARCVVFATALLAAGTRVSAHGGGAELRPALDPLPAALAGMRLELRETLGSQLVLENRTPRTVEVLDASGAPFVRIGPRGVEVDLASATWQRSLGPASGVPRALVEGDAPRWTRASAEPSYGWFDPRLAPGGSHAHGAAPRRFAVPLRVDGERVALTGWFRAEPAARESLRARLTSPSEPAPGVRVTLLPGRAPGLLVENASARTLLVFGAEGEPFLRIAPDGVDANLASRTWQLSARSASTPRAEGAASSRAPVWRRVAPGPRFAWVDPRALLRSTPAPDARGRSPGDAQEWGIPMQLGEEALLVTGLVSWRGQPKR